MVDLKPKKQKKGERKREMSSDKGFKRGNYERVLGKITLLRGP